MIRAPVMRAVFLVPFLLLAWSLSGQSAPVKVRIVGYAVEGNRTTKERIIARELTFAEGDTMSATELYQRLERSAQNLRNLSLFNAVELVPLYINQQEVFVHVMVNERWYWWPELIFKVADPNFNTWWLTRDLRRVNFGGYLNRYNFRGRNETLYLKLQFGYTKEFGLRYRIPNLDRRQRWGASIGGFHAEQNEVTVATVGGKRVFARYPDRGVRTERKLELQAVFRPGHDVRHHGRVSYLDARVADTVRAATNDYFRDNAERSAFFTLGYSIAFDRRDSRIFPLRGLYLEAAVDRAGIGVAGVAEPGVTLLRGRVEQHWALAPRWYIGGGVRARSMEGGRVPYHVQEGLGYGNYVRGYEYYVVDGQRSVAGKANLLFALLPQRQYRVEPIPFEAFRTLHLGLYLNAFIDAGKAWDDYYGSMNPLANTWLHGYGLGLDLVTSYDLVVRVEATRNGLGEHGLFLHFNQPF